MTYEHTKRALMEEFEEKWKDKGDERYGLVKHNNTILQRQIDWLSTALDTVRRETLNEAIAAEIKTLPSYPYNPDAAKAIVALEKLAQKTLWNEDIEQTATLMIENYRKQQQGDYIAMLEGQYRGNPTTLANLERLRDKPNEV